MPRWQTAIRESSSENSAADMTINATKAALNDDEKENNNGSHTNGLAGAQTPSNGLHPKYSDCEDGKESGGRSGRRKQSKPARVFLDLDVEGEASEAASRPAQQPAPPSTSSAAASAASKDGEKGEMEMEVDAIISCDLCNDTFPTQSALTDHIQSTHALSSDEPQAMEMYPTKYHRLGSELQQEVVFPTPVETKVDPAQNQDESSQSRPNSNGSESQNGNSKGRIFHQDAYCKLCDREFCNKYFLKIHMANKHGVYEDGVGPANGAPHLDIPPPSKPQDPAPTPSHPPAPPKPSLPSSTPSKSSNGKGSGSSHKSSSSKTSPDMEDYCEICQKHFCNKYYLRKHKNDVHGIAPETGSISGSKKGRPPANASNNSNTSSTSSSASSIASLPPATSANPLLLPQTTAPSPSTVAAAISAANSVPGLNSMANVMFINPFAPPVAILQTQPVLQSGSPAFPPHLPTLPTIPVSTSGDSPKASSTSNSPSSRTEISAGEAIRNLSKSGQLANDSLRSMGILNADAYCEICRKEFCNKYFLSIHKANKHGIYMDEGINPLLLPGMSLPENLSMRGGPEIGEASPLKIEKPEGKTKVESQPVSDEVCEICKKEFNNKFSLKIHLVNAHNIKPQDFDLGLELFKSDKMNGQSGPTTGGPTMFGNMMAAKLADRVTCDICNKEVCNKYFLKTHKIKVHGLDPAEVEKEFDNKTTPTKAATPATGNATSPAEAAKEALQRPNDEELLKMGIDPEAYCEICRKEFCSKYFLKTHKANIHGIKADGTAPQTISQSMPTMPSLPIAGMAKFTEQSLLRPQLPFGLPQTGAASMVPLPGALPLLPGQLPDHRSSPDSDSSKSENKWMWKEPINQTRVMCEICNKELCNKYFLKTHLMKKHGITYDITTGQMTPKDPPATKEDSLPASAPAQPEAKEVEADGSNNVVSAKTWSIPQDKQRGAESKLCKMEPMEVSPAIDDTQKCSVCGISFGEKVTLQFHMIRDHGGEVIIPSQQQPQQQAPPKAGPLKARFKRKLKKRRSRKAGPAPKPSQEVVPTPIKKQRFRCAQCKEHFSTRARCWRHFRQTHGSTSHPPMQAFRISASPYFPPNCIVRLPVVHRISKAVSASMTFTPADQ